MKKEFKSLSERIFSANNNSKTYIELYNLEIILKEAIKLLNNKIREISNLLVYAETKEEIKEVLERLEDLYYDRDKIFGDKLIEKEQGK